MATTAALLALRGVWSSRSQRADASRSKFATGESSPSPEMQKLLDAFAENWEVGETFEVSTSRKGKRANAATFGRQLRGIAKWRWRGTGELLGRES
jgi:hypothetical protein